MEKDNNIQKSQAYKLIEQVWLYSDLKSWFSLNSVMQDALSLAIKANMNFHVDDFKTIDNKMGGGYWLGVDSNGKTIGFLYYSIAIEHRNYSAIKSFEKFAGIKPFVSIDKHKLHIGYRFNDSNFRYRVTGFDTKKRTIHIVAYEKLDWKEKGKRKLLSFTNKEWNKVRGTFK